MGGLLAQGCLQVRMGTFGAFESGTFQLGVIEPWLLHYARAHKAPRPGCHGGFTGG